MTNSSQDFDKLKLDFISTVSHELRTPLTSIRGFTETLISSRDKLTDEQQLKFLNIIKDQSNRLINLVEDLLSASSKSDTEEIFILKPTTIQSAIDSSVDIIKQKYDKKNFKINTQKNMPQILADNEKFIQVLLNLLENACKYSFENSIIEINTNILDEKQVIISIENDSETIEKKDQKRIFEKFARLDTPMTRLTEGCGMGLYLTKKITEKMNGKISVHSENKHTKFSIIFPIATPELIAQNKINKKLRGEND